jgi:hypothetical protein
VSQVRYIDDSLHYISVGFRANTRSLECRHIDHIDTAYTRNLLINRFICNERITVASQSKMRTILVHAKTDRRL